MKIKRTIFIPIGPSIAYVPLTRGLWSLIDAEDAGWIGLDNWHAAHHKNSGEFYAHRKVPVGPYKTCSQGMHNAILKTPNGMQSDHISGNRLDNRRPNLRICTMSENGRNRGPNRNNKSGHKGIVWLASRQRWMGQLKVNRKNKCVGYFKTIEEAVAAMEVARPKLHGEFSKAA